MLIKINTNNIHINKICFVNITVYHVLDHRGIFHITFDVHLVSSNAMSKLGQKVMHGVSDLQSALRAF